MLSIAQKLIVVCPIPALEFLKLFASATEIRIKFLVMPAVMHPTQCQIFREQVKLWCIVTDDEFYDREFQVLMISRYGYRFQNALPILWPKLREMFLKKVQKERFVHILLLREFLEPIYDFRREPKLSQKPVCLGI